MNLAFWIGIALCWLELLAMVLLTQEEVAPSVRKITRTVQHSATESERITYGTLNSKVFWAVKRVTHIATTILRHAAGIIYINTTSSIRGLALHLGLGRPVMMGYFTLTLTVVSFIVVFNSTDEIEYAALALAVVLFTAVLFIAVLFIAVLAIAVLAVFEVVAIVYIVMRTALPAFPEGATLYLVEKVQALAPDMNNAIVKGVAAFGIIFLGFSTFLGNLSWETSTVLAFVLGFIFSAPILQGERNGYVEWLRCASPVKADQLC